ncbi:hypothetical protein GCM10022245_35520 [Streptomyces mayteni]
MDGSVHVRQQLRNLAGRVHERLRPFLAVECTCGGLAAIAPWLTA